MKIETCVLDIVVKTSAKSAKQVFFHQTAMLPNGASCWVYRIRELFTAEGRMAEYERTRSRQPDYLVIREIYEHVDAQEGFEAELEDALVSKIKYIIIEPAKLGGETSRWIRVGNFLHKSAVVSGVCSIMCLFYAPEREYIFYPLGFYSVFASGLYAISWQFDPCCKYQVETNVRKLRDLPLNSLSASSPVVLVRKDDYRRKFLQNIVSLMAASLCTWKLYNVYFR